MGRSIPGLCGPTPDLRVSSHARPERAHARPEVAHVRVEGPHSVLEGPFHTLRTLVSSEGPLLCQTVMSPSAGLTDKTRRICVV